MSWEDIRAAHELSQSNLATAKELVKGLKPKVSVTVKPPGIWVATDEDGGRYVVRTLEATGTQFVEQLRAWLKANRRVKP